MKAIRAHELGAPEVMKLEEVPTPTPKAGEVLVKIEAAGINPVDTYIRAGNYGAVPLPYTPGFDAAGVVEAIGDEVEKVEPGDRVYTAGTLTGAYAEYAICKESQVYLLPENVTFPQGAAVFVPYATAYRALIHKGGARPGDHVLIHGASGAVGIACLQIARALGIQATGTAGTGKGLEIVLKEGGEHAYNHTIEGYLDNAVNEVTGGKGFDVIIEMLANVNLDNDLDALAIEGRVIVVGSRGRIEMDPRKTMAKNTSIIGMTILNSSQADLESIHAALYAGLANGTLNPYVGRSFPLSDAAAAHHAVLEPGAHGKIVLVP